jgi:hypothetical protein
VNTKSINTSLHLIECTFLNKEEKKREELREFPDITRVYEYEFYYPVFERVYG